MMKTIDALYDNDGRKEHVEQFPVTFSCALTIIAVSVM